MRVNTAVGESSLSTGSRMEDETALAEDGCDGRTFIYYRFSSPG
jgi:hypothetical protein